MFFFVLSKKKKNYLSTSHDVLKTQFSWGKLSCAEFVMEIMHTEGAIHKGL